MMINMEINRIIKLLSQFIENKIPKKYLMDFQEILLGSSIFSLASEILAILIISIITLLLFLTLISIFSGLDIWITLLFSFLTPPAILITIIIIRSEKRTDEIEKAGPDFLRQLSSMLRVGLSFENAMENLSQYGSGPLYDEIRRAVIEMKIGRDFNESIIAMVHRLNSKDLERTFKIILNAKKVEEV